MSGFRTTNSAKKRLFAYGLLAGSIGVASVTHVVAEPACAPGLEFKDVQFSPMHPPTLQRKWSALLSVDASHCATPTGHFEIVFSRLKEVGPTVEFREQFIWRPNSAEISVAFWADEAVERYALSDIATCPCRQQ